MSRITAGLGLGLMRVPHIPKATTFFGQLDTSGRLLDANLINAPKHDQNDHFLKAKT